MRIKELAVVGLIVLSFTGCKNGTEKSESTALEAETREEPEQSLNIYGNYVSEDYDKRNEGYDWVSVAVSDAGPDKLNIRVRSRADRKKPTCTFDAIATKLNDTSYFSYLSGKKILYTFENNTIIIQPEKKEDEGELFFYCSGGASVAGTYKKIAGTIDDTQVDKTLFSKVLNLQGIGFNISSIKEDGKNTLTVMPFGLEISNSAVTIEISGVVTNAEIEDLNSDGSPEVLVYTQTEDEGKYGNVYGFTTNFKKSMSFIYFPPITENADLKQGYHGHDEFAIVETSLVQRFPIYENGTATGKMRQISYTLKDGEATRSFKVDNVTEY